MKAMVLGTARGARVRPITHTVPKPMIPLVRKPVMESVVELLAKHGFDQIVANTAHLAPSIENYFRRRMVRAIAHRHDAHLPPEAVPVVIDSLPD